MSSSPAVRDAALNYGDLTRILIDLGFERTVVRGSHVLFVRAYKRRPDVIVLLPNLPAARRVREHHLIQARIMVVENGIASRQRFDGLIATRGRTNELADALIAMVRREHPHAVAVGLAREDAHVSIRFTTPKENAKRAASKAHKHGWVRSASRSAFVRVAPAT